MGMRARADEVPWSPCQGVGQECSATSEAWPDPGVIISTPAGCPYPVEAFPWIVRDAIKEYGAYGKQPTALIASAALGAMALTAQGHADVARDSVLRGPCSLNILILGESGERKSAADSVFLSPVRQWAEEQSANRLNEHRKERSRVAVNEERRRVVQKRLADIETKPAGKPDDERQRLEARLAELDEEAVSLLVRPLPVLTYEDVTAEGLAHALATGWPSAGLVSDEAGIVLGGRGMSDEGALGLLTLLNALYDGRSFRPTRKTVPTAEIRGRRFSSSLMLQPALLDRIIAKGGRGVGFLARYLIAAPPSTKGRRPYTPPLAACRSLERYRQRIVDLLGLDLPVNGRFELEPPLMRLDKAAFELWRGYHDDIERELGRFGRYESVNDVGAKSAENAARIAAVFQVFESGPGGDISAASMEGGISLARWYLDEASRTFFETEKPVEVSDAELLSEWLVTAAPGLMDQGRPIMTGGRMSVGDILRFGPSRLRDKEELPGHPH